jgi:predicted extracellular nuclease
LKRALHPITLFLPVIAHLFLLFPASCQNNAINHPEKSPGCSVETANRVRIVCYNTENLFDTFNDSLTSDEDFLPAGTMHWTYKRYKAKLEKISKVLIATGEWSPDDIIGLCEIENRHVLYDLISNTPLAKYDYRFIHQDSPDERGIDVAMLYNPATVRIVETRFIPVDLYTFPKNTTRDILYCKVILKTQEALHLFINHWPSRSAGILETEPLRMTAARVLRAAIDSINRTQTAPKILIMGDFNDEPFDKSISQVLMARIPAEKPGVKILYDLSSDYIKRNGTGSHKYRGQWEMIDQVIVSGSLLTTEKGLRTGQGCFHVFDDPFLLREDKYHAGYEPFRTYKGPVYCGGFSDHLPVVINLYY